MNETKRALASAVADAISSLGAEVDEVPVQEVPSDRPGHYGSPVAFQLARQLKKNPAAIAAELVAALELPPGVARVEAVGPYINAFLDPGAYVATLVARRPVRPDRSDKVIVEHTSVNPNKEAHVGHLRNIVLGDATARILRAAGFDVEVQNYVDDTGRQAAESLYAVDYFGARHDGETKYDHWLGALYVRLTEAKEDDGEAIEAGVSEVMHRLERGELRDDVAEVVRAQLETFHALGAEYDLLVWESDVVAAGFLDRGLEVLRRSPKVSRPDEGKFAGALVMDVGELMPGLEESRVVLVRSDGNAVYVAKDIGYHFWKAGLFEGLGYRRFATQPSGHALYSSDPDGEPHPDDASFAHGQRIINVIDVRQSHPQTIVRSAFELSGTPEGHAAYEGFHHLAYEVVTLEGQAMSGRKGITLSIDEAIDEAVRRARAVIEEKNPGLADVDGVARRVGIGALRFGMLKSEAKRVIDFRWEQALSLQGDSAPYVQYAHARACSILRAAAEAGLVPAAADGSGRGASVADAAAGADWSQVGELELDLARTCARLPEVIESAADDLAPHVVAQYALDVATAWNGYYNHRGADGAPDTIVLKSPEGLREARLALVATVRDTLAASLALLGVEAPAEM